MLSVAIANPVGTNPNREEFATLFTRSSPDIARAAQLFAHLHPRVPDTR